MVLRASLLGVRVFHLTPYFLLFEYRGSPFTYARLTQAQENPILYFENTEGRPFPNMDFAEPKYTKIVKLCGRYADEVKTRFRFLRGQSGRWDRRDVLRMLDAVVYTQDQLEHRLGKARTSAGLIEAQRTLEDWLGATEGRKKDKSWWRALKIQTQVAVPPE